MVLEKSMDDMSQGVVIQADVEKYYDQLPLWKCLDALALRGLDARTAAACVRLNWQSSVLLCALGSQVAILPRSRGALTGSRSAVMLGKVPVETAVAKLAGAWVAKKWAWGLDGDTVSSAIYVNNVWLFSRTSGAALRMMKELQAELMDEWALKFKDDSKEIMVARGNETETYLDEEWEGVGVMKVLGLFVSNDGATAKSVEATLLDVQKMGWRAAAQVAKASLHWPRREKFLAGMTEGLLNSRWHMWSPSLALSARLDRVQRKLWSVALGIRRAPGEDWVAFVRRRGGTASRSISVRWGERQKVKAMAWTDHIVRGHVKCSTVNRVFGIRGLDWLRKRRWARQMTCTGGGRIGSRLPGHVRKRYEDSVDWARNHSGL
jgi:hypothetical protein